ncbi:hypothetical protein FVE85_9028 [Porphyridium purpureum]|uniref:Uncharacterized protein n=1 Tax=Porphyridium purpureum TaxID=35688 RepID=A0A5J4YN51_PORPP|nr:hypothetical protein FVE85_9028 [Porphyridium purpureum]|eukprot:POR7271..scf222_8
MMPKVLILLLLLVGVARASPVFREAETCDTCEQVGMCLADGNCDELKNAVINVVKDSMLLKRVRVTSFMTPDMPQQCDAFIGRTFRLTLDDGYALLEHPVMKVECDYCNDNSAILRQLRTNTNAHFVLSMEPQAFGLPSTAIKHLTTVPCVDDPNVNVHHRWVRDANLYYSYLTLNTEDDDILIVANFRDFWHCDPGFDVTTHTGYLQYQDFLIGRVGETVDSMHHGMTPGAMRRIREKNFDDCSEDELIKAGNGNVIGCLKILDEEVLSRPRRNGRQ